MRLSNKLLRQGYVGKRLKSSLRKFYGRYGDHTKQYVGNFLECYLDHHYCKLVIIRHVPIFAIFVSALNDEFTYWRI